MEFFQTIWTALTTENELALNITGIPLVFIESFISMLLFSTILDISSTKKQQILYVILFGVFSLFSAYLIPLPYNTIINLLICPILVLVIFKTGILKAILSEIVSYISFVLIGVITHNLLTFFF